MKYTEYELEFDELIDNALNELEPIQFSLFISYVCGRTGELMEADDDE